MTSKIVKFDGYYKVPEDVKEMEMMNEKDWRKCNPWIMRRERQEAPFMDHCKTFIGHVLKRYPMSIWNKPDFLRKKYAKVGRHQRALIDLLGTECFRKGKPYMGIQSHLAARIGTDRMKICKAVRQLKRRGLIIQINLSENPMSHNCFMFGTLVGKSRIVILPSDPDLSMEFDDRLNPDYKPPKKYDGCYLLFGPNKSENRKNTMERMNVYFKIIQYNKIMKRSM